MNPKVKKEWVKALRSGKYIQGRFHLKKNDKYCCLGVLTDLYNKKFKKRDRGLCSRNRTLSKRIQEWAQLKSDILCHDSIITLARLNDDGRSFAEIADIIEKDF